MTEKSYYADLTKLYVARSLELKRTIVWEAKFTRSGRISYKALAPHQELSLLQAERAYGLKLADVGRAKKPFDGLALYSALPIYVAIYYREKKSFLYEINFRDYIKERYSSKEKSLSEQRACVIGKVIKLKRK